jgi:hypothetical protein
MDEKRVEDMSREELVRRLKTVEMEREWLKIKVAQQMLFVRAIGMRRGQQQENRELRRILEWASTWIEVQVRVHGAEVTISERQILNRVRGIIRNEQE